MSELEQKNQVKESERLIAYPIGIINAVGAYLSERPYKEVIHLLQALETRGREVQETPPSPPSPPSPSHPIETQPG